VDLPDPLGPIIATFSSAVTLNETFCRAYVEPRLIVTLSNSNNSGVELFIVSSIKYLSSITMITESTNPASPV
jgi:hypothetical protein